MSLLTWLSVALLSISTLSVQAEPTVRISDIEASKIELETEADIHDYCLFGKGDDGVNFIVCSKVIGDMSRGAYKIETDPVGFNDGKVSFQLAIDPKGLRKGELTYVFQEQDVENPRAKSSTEFFQAVKNTIEEYGAAPLQITYVGPKFDTSLFGTPVPLFN